MYTRFKADMYVSITCFGGKEKRLNSRSEKNRFYFPLVVLSLFDFSRFRNSRKYDSRRLVKSGDVFDGDH